MGGKKNGLSAGAKSILESVGVREKALLERLAVQLAPRIDLIRSSTAEAKRLYTHVVDATWEDALAYIRANPPTPEVICALIFAAQNADRSDRARASAKKGQQENPERKVKAAAKAEVLKLWHEWQACKHSKLRTNEQFAIECMRRWPVLTSAATITRWCTKWSREAKNHSAS